MSENLKYIVIMLLYHMTIQNNSKSLFNEKNKKQMLENLKCI